jgi:hypothetical protein
MGIAKFCIADLNFLLTQKDFYICNEFTFREFRDPCLDTFTVFSPGRSQTFHIQTEQSVLQFAKEKYPQQVSYNEYNFHAIPAEYGGISFTGLCNQFTQEISKYHAIFTKGAQKVEVLKSILLSSTIPVFDLETFSCPPISVLINQFPVLQSSCIFHESTFQHCTAYKAELYAKWLKENRARMDLFWNLYAKQTVTSPVLLTPNYFLYTQQQQEQGQWHTPSSPSY